MGHAAAKLPQHKEQGHKVDEIPGGAADEGHEGIHPAALVLREKLAVFPHGAAGEVGNPPQQKVGAEEDKYHPKKPPKQVPQVVAKIGEGFLEVLPKLYAGGVEEVHDLSAEAGIHK